MTHDVLIHDACVHELLADLNASGSGVGRLDDLLARSDIETDRIIVGPDVTYVRLAGTAVAGGPVVILLFEGIWERATKRTTHPPQREAPHQARTPRALASIRTRARARRQEAGR